MNNNRIYNAIVVWCILLLLPLGLVLTFYRKKYNDQHITREKWERMLVRSMVIIGAEIVFISILFFQFGRYFIRVMGTFY